MNNSFTTLSASSSLEISLPEPEAISSLPPPPPNNVEAASFVGKIIAERAVKSGVSEVVFDRGGYIYHGRVKALADAARSAGLKF